MNSINRKLQHLMLLCSLLVLAAPAASQSGAKKSSAKVEPPSTVQLELRVSKLVQAGVEPGPFRSVGLFEILAGLTVIEKACPLTSNASGSVFCKLSCKAGDPTPEILLVRAPGADRVPGYSSPVSAEVKRQGCKVDQSQIAFTYKTLEVALAEVLSSDPQLAQAVTGQSAGVSAKDSFARLLPFEQSEGQLRSLAKSQSSSLARFSSIMRDAEVSAQKLPRVDAYTRWKTPASEYSTGTRSLLLQEAASRSLGPGASRSLIPITKDPKVLNGATLDLAAELRKKPNKLPYDLALEVELARSIPGQGGQDKAATDVKAMDWSAINRARVLQAQPARP